MNIDLKKRHREFYAPSSTSFVEVVIPPMRYLAASGHGDPNLEPSYRRAVSALYATAYAVRAVFTARVGDTFTVGPLEGLWSSADPADFVARRKGAWDWTMLIPMPDEVSNEDLISGRATASRSKPDLPVNDVTLLELDEGRCLQVLFTGSYDAEGPVLSDLHHRLLPQKGLTWNGPHHEIYLSDPRRVSPDRLRTVLRQPVIASEDPVPVA